MLLNLKRNMQINEIIPMYIINNGSKKAISIENVSFSRYCIYILSLNTHTELYKYRLLCRLILVI